MKLLIPNKNIAARARIRGIYLVIVALLAISFSLLPPPHTKAAVTTVRLYMSPTTSTLSSGSNVTMQIRLDKNSAARVDYVDAVVSFPIQLLEVSAISKTGSHFSANGGPTTSYSNSTGSIRVQGSGTNLPTTANVLVASITFHTKSAGTATLAFSSSSQTGNMLGSGSVKNYLTGTTSAKVTVLKPPASTTQLASPPRTTATPTTAAPSAPPVDAGVPATTAGPDITQSNDIPPDTELYASPTPSDTGTWKRALGVLAAIIVIIAGTIISLLAARNRARPRAKQADAPMDDAPEGLTTPLPDPEEAADDEEERRLLQSLSAPSASATPPVVHSVETIQSHPIQPEAKANLRSRPGLNASQVAPLPSTQANKTTKPPTQQPLAAQTTREATVQSPAPKHTPSITVPTAEQLAALPEDMFDAGAKRLELEGLGNSVAPKSNQPK